MTRDCESCGVAFVARQPTARFCSATCRQRAHRKTKSKPKLDVVKPKAVADLERYEREFAEMAELLRLGDVEAATRSELESAGRLESSAGKRALVLARLIDHPPFGTWSSVAGWSREHGAAMAVALADADKPVVKSALDAARERRDAKRHA